VETTDFDDRGSDCRRREPPRVLTAHRHHWNVFTASFRMRQNSRGLILLSRHCSTRRVHSSAERAGAGGVRGWVLFIATTSLVSLQEASHAAHAVENRLITGTSAPGALRDGAAGRGARGVVAPPVRDPR
jgi:hypothetical protein